MNKQSFHILSHDEQILLLDSLYQNGKIRDWTLIQLCLKTGLRNAEVCALNNSQVVKFGAVVTVLDIEKDIAYSNPRQLPLIDSVRGALKIYYQWKAQHEMSLALDAPFFNTLYTHKRLVPLDFQRIMANASKVTIEIHVSELPIMMDAIEMYEKGVTTSANHDNRAMVERFTRFDKGHSEWHEEVLFDPQTNGGLLISVPSRLGKKLLQILRNGGVEHASIIGQVIPFNNYYLQFV